MLYSTLLWGYILGLLSAVQAQNTTTLSHSNPVIFADFPDNDVSRGPDGAYYLSGSSFSYSPGAPILRSHDLVNWELIGHSVPVLDFGDEYYMNRGTPPQYVGGVWASSMRYRASNKKWYWVGCINFYVSYVYTADNVTGPWEQSAAISGTCFYDCGLLIDDDDSMYVVYGNTNVSVAQLAPDGFSIVKTQQQFSSLNIGLQPIEGNRLYKINGTYYVLDDSYQGCTLIWKSQSVWGPWQQKFIQNTVYTPILAGGVPDQGSLVEGPDGKWYFMSFLWNFPAGRLPMLAPLEWDNEGFPYLTSWPANVSVSGVEAAPVPPMTGTDTFPGTTLSPQWEWNFNPITTSYAVNNGVELSTATVTDDLYAAANTLTHRTYGAKPVGTVELDISKMAVGDRAGLAAFSYMSAWIEVYRKQGSSYQVRMVSNATQDSSNSWVTINKGTVLQTATLKPANSSAARVWFKATLNTVPNSSRKAAFSYSTDGKSFMPLGQPYVMSSDFVSFMGYRYAIFNFATTALGGMVKVLSFTSA